MGATQILDEKKSKEIKQSDTKLSFDMNAEKQQLKEVEAKVAKAADEKHYNLKLELAKEKKIREEAEDRYENTFGVQLAHL